MSPADSSITHVHEAVHVPS